jgi:hypothetical protein
MEYRLDVLKAIIGSDEVRVNYVHSATSSTPNIIDCTALYYRDGKIDSAYPVPVTQTQYNDMLNSNVW